MILHSAEHRHMGKFMLPFRQLEDTPTALAVLDGVVIIRAEARYDRMGIEYVGIHPGFDPVGDNQQIPRYHPVVSGGRRAWARHPPPMTRP